MFVFVTLDAPKFAGLDAEIDPESVCWESDRDIAALILPKVAYQSRCCPPLPNGNAPRRGRVSQ